jgi:hypothetical protein
MEVNRGYNKKECRPRYKYMANEEFGQNLAMHNRLSLLLGKRIDQRSFRYAATIKFIEGLTTKEPVSYGDLVPTIYDALQDLDPVFVKSFFADDQLTNNQCRRNFYKQLMNDPQMTRMFNYPAIEHDFQICSEDVLMKYVNWIVYLATSDDGVDRKYSHLYAKDSALLVQYAINRKFNRLLFRMLDPRKGMAVLPNLEHIYPMIVGSSVSYQVIDLFVRYDPLYYGQHLPQFVLNAYLQYAKMHGEEFTQILNNKFADPAILAEGMSQNNVPCEHEEGSGFYFEEGVSPSKQVFDYPEEGAEGFPNVKKQSLWALC